MKRFLVSLLSVLIVCALTLAAWGEGASLSIEAEVDELWIAEDALEIVADGEGEADAPEPVAFLMDGDDGLPEGEAAADSAQAPISNAGGTLILEDERFPDRAFRQAIAKRYGDGSGYVDYLNLKDLYVADSGITNLTGIECFPNLDTLDCSGNPVKILELKDCPKLRILDCRDTELSVLNVAACPTLKSVYCSGPNLTRLDTFDNGKLEIIDISGSQITSLDVHNYSTLQAVNCDKGKLSSLNASGCSQLVSLYLPGNRLTTLNVNDCSALQFLNCDDNQLTGLSLANLAELISLSCKNNPMTSLSVSNCAALETLDCSGGGLTTLNVSNCPALCSLNCRDNALTGLNLSGCPDLVELSCAGNRLAKLPTEALAAVMELDCSNNRLTALDATKCPKLSTLDCSNNQLTVLDLSGCREVYSVDCYNNKLTSLNVDNCAGLERLHAHGNPLASIELGKSALHGIPGNEISEDSFDGVSVMTYRGDLGQGGWADCYGWALTFDASVKVLDGGKTLYAYVAPTAPITPPPGSSSDPTPTPGQTPTPTPAATPKPTATPTPKPTADARSVANATITVGDAVYTGKALKPAVKVKLGGKTLKSGTDYTVKYANNKAVGQATVTVAGKGKYTGTAKVNFNINPKAVAGLKLTAGKKALAVAWKKGAGITGYEIQYGLKKKLTDAQTVTVKKAKTVKTSLKKLQAKKTYYVRIRAYKTVGGKTYYSAWSAAKSKKTK